MALKPARLPPIDADGSSEFNKNHGPSYKLHGTRHYLPPQRVLRPNQDTSSGELETWPAYASRSMSDTNIIASSKHNVLSLKTVLPKPKFLEALETYVHKEIIHLDCTDPKPSELRLQAYREVFEYLIGDFKTYRPLLSQIKDEYEKMLSHYREKIRELEPLKSMLVTVSEQCDQKILKIREEERREIIDLKHQKMELLKHIDKRHEEEKSLNAQINKLQEELTKQYKMYRDECDMRKLLVSDMNDLRAQLDDLRKSSGQGGIDIEDDPVRLKIALQVARDDLSRQADELNRIKADYGDVVPRRNFEILEANHTKLDEDFTTLKSDFTTLKNDHDTLLDVHKQVIEQRDDYFNQTDTLRRNATPRPQWKRCGKIVPGGPENWKELTHKKRSAEILDTLINLFKSGADGPDSFEGNADESTPKFLRFEGKIKNRKLDKSETNKVLKALWAWKREKLEPMLMEESVYEYFKNKYNNDEEMMAEWGYSLNEALNNYQNEPHFMLFKDILDDQLSEAAYRREGVIIKKIMETFQSLDNDGSGILNRDQFMHALETALPIKTSDDRDALCASAVTELDSAADVTSMDYRLLFTEDEEGHTGLFITQILQQEKEERELYVQEIQKQLDGIEPVSTADFKRTLMDLDPQINQEIMSNYIMLAFECSKENINEPENAALDIIITRLKKGAVHRIGPVY